MRIDDPHFSQLPQLKRLWQTAFGDEGDFVELFFKTAYAPTRCRVAMEGERVAAMLFWLDASCQGRQCAYLYAVAVHPDFRGLGLCRALMENTHTLLTERGYAAALLYPADEGLRQMYGKMGYVNCGRVREWTCAAGEPVLMRQVSGTEYAHLRRQYLPADGVIQAGENMALLEETAELYSGEDFLVAAVREGETLAALELMGREEAAPGILGALGCRKGIFHRGRAVMMHPLSADTPMPGYLGLVFD